jgi:hypothetical protein
MYRALPPLLPDSQTYLDWNPGRTAAYPIVLALVRLVSTDTAVLGWLQLAVLIISTITLARTFFAVYRNQLAAAALAAAILLHPQLVSYAFTVLPESLFMSLLMLHLSCVLRYTHAATPASLAAAGGTLAGLILLKPAAYALCACLPLLVLHRPQWLKRLVRAAAPIVIVLLVASAANLAVRGFFAPQAQGGYSLVAHVGAFVDPDDERYPAAADGIAADAAPHRRALERIRSLEVYYVFSSHDYHALERIVRRRIAEASEARRGVAVTDHRQFPNDPALLQDLTVIGGGLARRAIADHPSAYLRHVAAQFYGLWMLPLIQPPARITELEQALNEIVRAAPGVERPIVAFRAVPWPLFVGVRALLVACFVLSLLSVVIFVFRSPASPWLPAAYAGLAIHANFLLVSAVQPGLPRYALVLWPAAALVMFAVPVLAIGSARGRSTGALALNGSTR